MVSKLAKALVVLVGVDACNTPNSQLTNFDPIAFSGVWFLAYSTIYKSKRVGCASWTLTQPNSKKLLETSFSKNIIFSWNFLDTGNTYVSSENLAYTNEGILSTSYLFNSFKLESNRVIATDYLTYAVVYNCGFEDSIFDKLELWKDQI